VISTAPKQSLEARPGGRKACNYGHLRVAAMGRRVNSLAPDEESAARADSANASASGRSIVHPEHESAPAHHNAPVAQLMVYNKR